MSVDQTPDPVDVEIGGRVRTQREGQGRTQAQLADAIGVTFQQVQKYENGKNRISAARLLRIAFFLQCSPQDLLGPVHGEAGMTEITRMAGDPDGAVLAAAFNGLPAWRRKILATLAHDMLTASDVEIRRSA